jgi:hypothetical protein
MTSPEPSNPVAHRLVAAINDGDRDAFLATLTPHAMLTDNGNPRSLHDLCVPKTSSTSCDQVIFVDQASDVSAFPDAVQVEVGEFR